MGKKGKHTRLIMRLLLAAIVVAGIVFWIVRAEKPEPERFVPNASDGNTTPTMATTDVSTLISDSGYTKYHVTAAVWQMFEDAEEPFWRFPDGLELEQYDTEMRPQSSVVCDSAVYFSRKRLWRLDGNVVMVNTQADSFLTQQLFWDQQSRKIYSDSFIHIVRTDRTIEGYGFESEQNMLSYTVNHPTAILPAERRPGQRRDTAATVADTVINTATAADTVAPPAPRHQPRNRTMRRPRAGQNSQNQAGNEVQRAEKAILEPVKE